MVTWKIKDDQRAEELGIHLCDGVLVVPSSMDTDWKAFIEKAVQDGILEKKVEEEKLYIYRPERKHKKSRDKYGR